MKTDLHNQLERLEYLLEKNYIANKAVFNADEASDYLGVSKSYLYKLTHQRLIACYRPQGKLLYFRKEDLDTWIFRNRQESKDELAKEAIAFINN